MVVDARVHRASVDFVVCAGGGASEAFDIGGVVAPVREVELDADVLFASGSAEISAPADAMISHIAEILTPHPNAVIVEGHTDNRPISTPQFPSNWELSIARSLSVVRYLIEQGIPKNRLVAAGHAEFHPRDTGASEEAFQRNRRVEVRFLEN